MSSGVPMLVPPPPRHLSSVYMRSEGTEPVPGHWQPLSYQAITDTELYVLITLACLPL